MSRLSLAGSFGAGATGYDTVPFEVPPGTDHLTFRFHYEPADRGRIGFGLFGPEGAEQGNEAGFRGWSDHWRNEVRLCAHAATPGYLPGPLAAGTWYLLLAPHQLTAARTAWRVDVELDGPETCAVADRPPVAPFVARPANSAVRTGTAWYRGDLHVHTDHSSDEPLGHPNQLPAEAVRAARAAGLDYFVSTEHNTPSSHAIWGHQATSDLLVLNGEEVTTRSGHIGAVGLTAGRWIDFRLTDDAAVADAIRAIDHDGGIAVLNHALHYEGTDCFWGFGVDPRFGAMEVWNAGWGPLNEALLELWTRLLAEGRRITAVAGSDAHAPPHVVGAPQTVVLATGLSRDAIVAGLRGGRAYLGGSARDVVQFDAASGGARAGIGDVLEVTACARAELTIKVRVTRSGTAHLLDDAGVVETFPVVAHEVRTRRSHARRDSLFARLEVRATDGQMLAMTNPIWFDRLDATRGNG